jgi:hypothetical protein
VSPLAAGYFSTNSNRKQPPADSADNGLEKKRFIPFPASYNREVQFHSTE